MTTYRERREARAERLRDWAEKREARSAAAFQAAHQRADMIPFGQPILVGHHSEKRHRRDLGRIDSSMRQGVESARKAESMQSRASNIESQLAGAIYSDDPDAIPALEARLAKLEAKRERIKADNAAFRKAVKAAGLAKSEMPYSWQGGKFQGHTLHADFELTNLTGDISRNRHRLEDLQRRAGRSAPPARSAEAERRIRETLPPPPPPGPLGQMGLFRVSGAELERERRRRSRQAKGQRRRRDGRFR